MKKLWPILPMLLMALTTSCVQLKPIEVKPIHITMDVNVKVDKQLDDFFAFEDELEAGEDTKEESK